MDGEVRDGCVRFVAAFVAEQLDTSFIALERGDAAVFSRDWGYHLGLHAIRPG